MNLRLTRTTTLSRRLLLRIVPVSLAAIALLGVCGFYVTKHHLTAEIEKNLALFSRSAAARVDEFFSQRRNDLETVSQNSLFADYYNNTDYGLREEAEQYRQELARYFLGFSRRTGAYLSIVYADASGREVCRVEGDRIAGPRGEYPERHVLTGARALKKAETLLFPVLNKPGYGPAAVYSRAVFDSAGAFRGMIAMEAGLKPLQESLSRLALGSSGRILVTDQLGRLVVSGGASTDDGGRYDFSSSVPVAGEDFVVTVTARLKDFQAPMLIIQRFTLLFALLFCAVAALSIYFTIRGITRPIRGLAEATRRFAAGNLKERVPVDGADEISALSSAFNTMAEQLMRRTGEMEARITELLFLQDMSAEVVGNLSEDNISRVCLRAAVAGLGFDRGTIYLVNKEGTHLVGRKVHSPHQKDFTDEDMRKRTVALDGGDVLAEAVRTRKPLLVTDPGSDPRVNKAFVDEVQTRSFCLVPIMTEQRVLGVMGVDNYYSGAGITADHLSKLILFCNFTALALENAALVTDVRVSRERYRAVLDNSPEAILGLDAGFRVTVWNKGAKELFGYAEEEMLGSSASRLFDPLAFEVFSRELAAKGSFADPCVPGIGSNGNKLELYVICAGSGTGRRGGEEWTAVIRDTSEQRKMQAQLIQAEKLSAVGQLISGVAHEMSNPLSVILGLSEMFHRSGADPVKVTAEEMTLLFRSSLRCGDIARNLLAFVRESRKKKQAVSIPEAVDGAVTLMEYKLRRTDNIVIRKIYGEHLPPVLTDLSQLEQILVNLIQNARDAMSRQTGEKTITINAFRREEAVVITVADNGPGIPAADLPRVFEPFFTTKAEGQGTGLGLAICRRIAEEHGGRISCESAYGMGTVFTLQLPIVNQSLEDEAGKSCPTSLPPGKCVLVVDDEPDMLRMTRKILEAEGLLVHTASSAPEAIEKLKAGGYDAVLCDVEMGPAKGFSVREKFLELNSEAGFVFTTGNMLNPALVSRLKEYRVPFLPKPFNQTELVSAISEALSRPACGANDDIKAAPSGG